MATKAEISQQLKLWQEQVRSIMSATPVDAGMPESEKLRMKARLERRPVEWARYFFPMYATHPFADFQIKAIQRITGHMEWFEVLSWARELGKSVIVMMCVLFLVLTGRKRNVILASATEKAAERLLAPYRAMLEGNLRIRFFYGDQMNPGQWTSLHFVTRGGASFMGVGAGNAPRGSRNEAVRPDVLLVDDFDTDEDCRNPAVLDKKWDWWEKALFPTRSVSEETLIVFCGNIIAKDTCVARAGARADHWDVVNIVDRDGNSTWPEKNTPENIERIRASISTKAFQGEYMNNPVTEGKIFRNLPLGKVPPLERFQFLVCYGDPAYSNRKNKADSTKAVCLMGFLKGVYYIVKAFVGRVTNAEYLEWFYLMQDYVGSRTAVLFYQENNSLQDPFFEQVFKPLLRELNGRRHRSLYIREDARAKIDKASRIEAGLEPLDRNGQWVFNEDEADNPHMAELLDQFRLFELSLPYCADGPDCVEGAKTIIDRRLRECSYTVDTLSPQDLIRKDKRM